MIAAIFAVAAYLLGSVPSGLIVGRVYRGIDVRNYGSGKTGFTNTLRMFGLGAALIVVASDLAKGAVPVLLARFVFDDPMAAALGGIAAILGHTFPVFAGFRGGRGVATAFGAFAAIAPVAALIVAIVAFAILGLTRYVSLMSITGTPAGFIGIIVLVATGWLDPEYLLFGAVATVAIELNHLPNMRRLLNGAEPKIGQGGTPRTEGV